MAKVEIKGIKGRPQLYHAVLDVDVSGDGSVGTLDLFNLKAGSILHDFWIEVETLVASGGAATLDVGYSGDADAVLLQRALGDLVADYITEEDEKGADLYDGVNGHGRKKKFAADTVIQSTVGTAALTAGKIHFYAKVSDGY